MSYIGHIIEKPVDDWNQYREISEWCNSRGDCFIDENEESYEVKLLDKKDIENEARIAELKKKLSDTDYVVVKIAEGSATKEEYEDVISKRREWRKEINELEMK